MSKLTELTKQMPGLELPASPSPTPAGGDTHVNVRELVDQPHERELVEGLMQILKRVEAAQAHAVADLRREIAQTFGQLVLALERPSELSDGSVQKLQVALADPARERTQQRILNELTLLKGDLERQTAEVTGKRKRIRLIVIFGIGIMLFGAGVAAGTLVAPWIALWLP